MLPCKALQAGTSQPELSSMPAGITRCDTQLCLIPLAHAKTVPGAAKTPAHLQFGEISIDSDLVMIARNDSTEILELPNGCACCDVQGELIEALFTIVRPAPASHSKPVHAVCWGITVYT